MPKLDVWKNKVNIIQNIEHSPRLLVLVILITANNEFLRSIMVLSRVSMDKINQIPWIKCGYTVLPQSCVQGNDFCFCWTVRNWSLFLPHPTDWNKRMASKNAQCSTWCRFWILKISRKIGVLKQSQSALFCSVTHITILPVFTCVMNVRYQSIQAFVTGFGPFGDRSCKFVHWPFEYQVFQYVPSISISEQFESILLTILPRISILLWNDGHQCMELILCGVVELSCSPTHNIVPHISWHALPCHKTTKKYADFPSMVIFQLLLQKFWIHTWFCNCQQYLCLFHTVFWVHPRYTRSRKDVGSPKSTSLLRTFHIGSMFLFLSSQFDVIHIHR